VVGGIYIYTYQSRSRKIKNTTALFPALLVVPAYRWTRTATNIMQALAPKYPITRRYQLERSSNDSNGIRAYVASDAFPLCH